MKNSTLILFLLANLTVWSQSSAAERKAHFNVNNNLAIDGYDPVSYFSKKPEKGTPTIAYAHHGILYHFKTEMNRAQFIDDPKKFEPTYGGWCAYAMGLIDAEKVSINPKTYKIIDNKLYLFYNKYGINTLNKWNDNEKALKQNAAKNWTKIISN